MPIVFQGGQILFKSGAIAMDTRCCCAACDWCFGGDGDDSIYRDAEPLPTDPPIDGPDRYQTNKIRCHRLFIWECISHDGDQFTNTSTPVVVKTNAYAARFDGANYTPFREEFNSGAYLTDKPYWWPHCGVGGWTLASPWFTPPISTLYGYIRSAMGSEMPSQGTRFTLLVLVRFWKRRRNLLRHAEGLEPLLVRKQSEPEGGYEFLRWWLECC